MQSKLAVNPSGYSDCSDTKADSAADVEEQFDVVISIMVSDVTAVLGSGSQLRSASWIGYKGPNFDEHDEKS
jgi:hypothetical protein